MNRLTPELWLHSAFDGTSNTEETRELDFNLARRSAVVINRIVGQMHQNPDTTTGFDTLVGLVQEVDVDPDNDDTELGGIPRPDGVVIDSSRVFRQTMHASWDTAAGPTGFTHNLLQKDWTSFPLQERPISITNLRHHVNSLATISCVYHAEINIDYIIVELSLTEIGILNASRR